MLVEAAEHDFIAAWSKWVLLNPFDHADTRPLRELLLQSDLGLAAEAQRLPPLEGSERP
jgi:hypothetical protein